jgi:MarR family transcriptional regulator for hemolysin
MALLRDECARDLLEVVPSMTSFVRSEMRGHRTHGLSVPQFRALLHVSRAPGASLGDVAEHLGLAPASTSTLVDGLVRRKLVVRTASTSDRRRVALELSAAGRAAIEFTTREAQKALSVALAPLTTNQLKAIHQAVPPLRAAFSSDTRRAPTLARAPKGA